MYSDIGGQNIYYQKVGRCKNLILIHGWGESVSSFWPIVDLLKEDFTLWLIDLPGFGKSDLPKRTFTALDFAKIIAGFIKKNNIEKPTVFGHSFGGKVAIQLAKTYPDLIDKLILEGSSGIKPERSFFQVLIFPFVKIGHFLLPNVFNIKSQIQNILYKKLESDYVNVGKMKDIFLRTIKENISVDLPKIQTETLLIWGEKDRAVPLKYGKKMYHLIPKSKLVVLENTGHFPHVKQAERVAYYVKDFI